MLFELIVMIVLTVTVLGILVNKKYKQLMTDVEQEIVEFMK